MNCKTHTVRAFIGTLFVCLLMVCATTAQAQEASTPPAPPKASTPSAPSVLPRTQSITPKPARPRTRVVVNPDAPRAPKAVISPSPALAPAQQTPGARLPRPAAPSPPAPRQVVTVVHRLSGWKLLRWLATSGPTALELDDLPSEADAHTNIVAGFVSDDGRTVVARLPRAEAELESLPISQPPPGLFATTTVDAEEPAFTLVTVDGRRVGATFVGLDASTGLSLLEAEQSVLPPATPIGGEGNTEDPTVGQRVHLFAPTPAPQRGVGYVYLSIDQKEGFLTQVRRAPSGKPSRVVARAANVTPAWTGAIAANELGEVVGIVSQSDSGETQIVPVATILGARERVMKLRGSAPQPWLGVRGDASLKSPLDDWVNTGWKPESAVPYIQNGQGVLLTAVAPGTPAALAGLRPGDVIAQVGTREVRSVEDLSFTLNEAGVGSTVDFTIWRAREPAPVKLSVQLLGAQNPALATAEAEARDARESLVSLQQKVRGVRDEEQRLKTSTSSTSTDDAALRQLSERLHDIEERMEAIKIQMDLAEARVFAARDYTTTATTLAPSAPATHAVAASTRLEACGLNVIGLTTRSAARLGARGGLLVIAVRGESPAASAGLRAGDVIETLNGATYDRFELRHLRYAPDAKPVSLGVVRLGQKLTLMLQLASSFETEK